LASSHSAVEINDGVHWVKLAVITQLIEPSSKQS
jgi:hypothetical protein